jgi:hypothetical protein
VPSSISSSDLLVIEAPLSVVRLTAADRPGVAQPVPERDIPAQPWLAIWLGAALLALLALGAWESYWRAFGVTPSYRNSNGAWAQQRGRIDRGEGNRTVLIGSSRVLFDVQLPQWQQITGERPIQLALEGTSAVPVLEDLAADPRFTGRLLVGVAPTLFFSGQAFRGDVLAYTHKQGPSQRAGHWLSAHLLEPYLAFDDPDFALDTVLKRQPWPVRPGTHPRPAVRKLANSEADRNTHMWPKLETDAGYRAVVRGIWMQLITAPPPPEMATPAALQRVIDTQINRAAMAVNALHARGVKVVFVRMPSIGPFYAMEEKVMPRARTWDALLQRTHAPGIHFMDNLPLQGYQQPEWSHLSAPEAKRFTTALVPIVEQAFSEHAVQSH